MGRRKGIFVEDSLSHSCEGTYWHAMAFKFCMPSSPSFRQLPKISILLLRNRTTTYNYQDRMFLNAIRMSGIILLLFCTAFDLVIFFA